MIRRTHIIILNWNGAEDTWACVNSVLSLEGVRITLLDNASTDQSISYVERGLNETACAYCKIPAKELADSQNETIHADYKIRIVLSALNLGFSAGINLILKPLLNSLEPEYIWLLNNDAIAAPDTLDRLLTAIEQDPFIGFAGSLIMDGKDHEMIQCFGVRYYRWFGVGKMMFKNQKLSSLSKEAQAKNSGDFQHGASLLIRKELIQKIGLLDERFFLYSEEQDWQSRAARMGFKNIRVKESKVYHLGSMSTIRSRHLFFYYYCRSALIYSRKHQPLGVNLLATMMLSMITLIRTRLHVKSMTWALKGIREAWMVKL